MTTRGRKPLPSVIGTPNIDEALVRADMADADALQGVTDVARGMDLFHATSVHRLLQALLDLPAPNYRHHRLILDEEGDKLAKSRGSTTLRDLRAAGATPADIRRMVGLA